MCHDQNTCRQGLEPRDNRCYCPGTDQIAAYATECAGPPPPLDACTSGKVIINKTCTCPFEMIDKGGRCVPHTDPPPQPQPPKPPTPTPPGPGPDAATITQDQIDADVASCANTGGAAVSCCNDPSQCMVSLGVTPPPDQGSLSLQQYCSRPRCRTRG